MADDLWTIKSILEWCSGYLERAGDEQPRLSAQWLLSEATGLSRIDLYTNFDRPLTADERDTMRSWVRRRAKGEPLQLICGTAPFRYLTLAVAPGVLIPRPETEVLVSEALAELSLPRVADHVRTGDEGEEIIAADMRPIRVIDLCTGSGCIACAIASEYPAARVLALDVAPEALDLARRNAEALGLSERVCVRESDLLSAVEPDARGTFDLVISNPPYVPSAVVDGLGREVADFEPRLALDGGADGLDLYRRFLPDALSCLKPGGVLAVELYEGHLDEAARLAREAGFDAVRIVRDLAGRPRVLIGHAPAGE